MKKLLFIIMFLGVFAFSMSTSFADRLATLVWDSNTESDLAGYRVYEVLPDGSYVLISDVGDVVSYPLVITNILEHTYVLTAYDTSNNESGYSLEAIAAAIIIDTSAPFEPGGFNINVQVIVNTP